MKHVIFIMSAIMLCGCSDGNNPEKLIVPQPAPAEAETITDVAYGSDPQQTMDIYLPAAHTGATKVIIMVHGGGWTDGSKEDMNAILASFRPSMPDYAYVNINYRLATTGDPAFPKQIDDLGLVISKLESLNYSISKDYAFLGVSAGAHLALLYTYKVDTSHKVKTVVSIVGPTDFSDPAYTGAGIDLSSYVYLTGGNTDPEYFASLSPVSFVTAQSPPTIQINGTADPLVPPSQGVRLKEKLDAFGVVNERYVYAGGHNDFSIPDIQNESFVIRQFLRAHF